MGLRWRWHGRKISWGAWNVTNYFNTTFKYCW